MQPSTFDPDSDAGQALARWWAELSDRRGERAGLSRCHNLDEVATCAEYHQAYRREFIGLKLNRDAMPAVLGLLARIRNRDSRPLPEALAKGKGKDGRGLSELRFRRLIQCETMDELFAALRRALALIGNSARIHELADLIYGWQWPGSRDRLRKSLAYSFYEHLPSK